MNTLKLKALLAGVRSAVGKSGKTGYYLSCLVGGQPATFYTSVLPACAASMVVSEMDGKTLVPKDDDVVEVELEIGVRFYKGAPSIDLRSVVLL